MTSLVTRLWPYVRLARPDHWFKSAFMLLGVLLALFYQPHLWRLAALPALALALFCTCIVASSNYVLNELLDADRDRLHPVKQNRPAVQGRIRWWPAILEWLGLGALGVGLAFRLNRVFGVVALALWLMGCVYNIPPVRSKELPYLDVLSESLNNPLRLLLGWHAFIVDRFPPVSLLLAYWMLGAFFMATKRLAEYRHLGDKERAAAYRSSFRHYDAERLLVSIVFYVTLAALFLGIFIVRYKLELILAVPGLAAFLAYYFRLGLLADSPVETPEKLYQQRALMLGVLGMAALCILLMLSDIPALYDLFNVEPAHFEPLWRLGR